MAFIIVLAGLFLVGVASDVGPGGSQTLGVVLTLGATVALYAIFVPLVRKDFQKKHDTWAAKKALHDAGWVCLKCGASWIP